MTMFLYILYCFGTAFIALESHSIEKNIELENEFNTLYQQWKVKVSTTVSIKFQSNTYPYIETEEFQAILKLGLPSLPFMVEKIRNGTGLEQECFAVAIRLLTKRTITAASADNTPIHVQYLQWWDEGHKEVNETFSSLYEKWISAPPEEQSKNMFIEDWYNMGKEEFNARFEEWKKTPNGEEYEKKRPFARTLYQRILDLGIGALPIAMEHYLNGEESLFDMIDYWTDGEVGRYLNDKQISQENRQEEMAKWWTENQNNYTIPFD